MANKLFQDGDDDGKTMTVQELTLGNDDDDDKTMAIRDEDFDDQLGNDDDDDKTMKVQELIQKLFQRRLRRTTLPRRQ